MPTAKNSGYKMLKTTRRLYEFHASYRRIRRLYFYLPSFLTGSYHRLKVKSSQFYLGLFAIEELFQRVM